MLSAKNTTCTGSWTAATQHRASLRHVECSRPGAAIEGAMEAPVVSFTGSLAAPCGQCPGRNRARATWGC
jgi:hypothetical protein